MCIRDRLEKAREEIAACIGAQPNEIYFTSGGSEADNQAIVSAAKWGARRNKKHIISTTFEHHAVLHTLQKLEKEGYEVTYLDVHENGIVQPEEVAAAIRPDTCLVTIMYANNEIGSIQPIVEIGAVCKEKGVYFHTDAAVSYTHLAELLQLLPVQPVLHILIWQRKVWKKQQNLIIVLLK